MSKPLPTWPTSILNLLMIRPVCWWHLKKICTTTYAYHVSSWLRCRNTIRTAVLLWLAWTDNFLGHLSTVRVKFNICICRMGGPQSGPFERLLISFKIYGPTLYKSVTTNVQPWHPKARRTFPIEKWNKVQIVSVWSYSIQFFTIYNKIVLSRNRLSLLYYYTFVI